MSRNDLKDYAAQPILAALALLDTALFTVARAVRASDLRPLRAPWPSDPAALAAAAQSLVEECELALYVLDAYREQIYTCIDLHDHPDPDCPF